MPKPDKEAEIAQVMFDAEQREKEREMSEEVKPLSDEERARRVDAAMVNVHVRGFPEIVTIAQGVLQWNATVEEREGRIKVLEETIRRIDGERRTAQVVAHEIGPTSVDTYFNAIARLCEEAMPGGGNHERKPTIP